MTTTPRQTDDRQPRCEYVVGREHYTDVHCGDPATGRMAGTHLCDRHARSFREARVARQSWT